ncbi:MAG: hypothetical protein AVDCRST_MAG49-2317, partial [uncultured Thermomicrobiales bacterium]
GPPRSRRDLVARARTHHPHSRWLPWPPPRRPQPASSL